jgi:hypothetical protein
MNHACFAFPGTDAMDVDIHTPGDAQIALEGTLHRGIGFGCHMAHAAVLSIRAPQAIPDSKRLFDSPRSPVNLHASVLTGADMSEEEFIAMKEKTGRVIPETECLFDGKVCGQCSCGVDRFALCIHLFVHV